MAGRGVLVAAVGLVLWLVLLALCRRAAIAWDLPGVSFAPVYATALLCGLSPFLVPLRMPWQGVLFAACLIMWAPLWARGRRAHVNASRPTDRALPQQPGWGVWGVQFLTFALLGSVATTTFLWDEGSTHFGVPQALARGTYPAVHPLFGQAPFAYHLGYDFLVAQVLVWTPLRSAVACDVVTLWCALLLVLAAADLGFVLHGPRGAAVAVVLLTFGGGVLSLAVAGGWGAWPASSALLRPWLPAMLNVHTLPPPVASSFFQHPQGLAMPLCCLLLARFGQQPTPKMALILAPVVVALGHAQIVYFAATGFCLAGLSLLAAIRTRAGLVGLLRLVGPWVVALLVVALTSPFVRSAAPRFIAWGGYFATQDATAAQVLFGTFVVVGLAPAIALAGVFSARPPAPAPVRALAIMACSAGLLCLLVASVAHYTRSFDIVKFYAVACFFLHLASVPFLAAGTQKRMAFLVVTVAVGVFFVLRHGVLNGVVAARYTEAPPPAHIEALGDALPGPVRLLTHDVLAHQAGLIVIGADWRKAERGYALDRPSQDRERAAAQAALQRPTRTALCALSATHLALTPKERHALDPAGTDALSTLTPLPPTADGHFELWRVPCAETRGTR